MMQPSSIHISVLSLNPSILRSSIYTPFFERIMSPSNNLHRELGKKGNQFASVGKIRPQIILSVI